MRINRGPFVNYSKPSWFSFIVNRFDTFPNSYSAGKFKNEKNEEETKKLKID